MKMTKTLAIVFAALFLVGACMGPALHPYSMPKCGYTGHECRSTGLCCSEVEDCGGEVTGCPAEGNVCCYRGDLSGMQLKPGRFQ